MSHKGHSHVPRSSMVLFMWSGFHFMVGIGNLLIYGASQVLFVIHLLSHVWLHELQHVRRLPCPSPSPRVCQSSCPLNMWCHPIISSSAIPFSSCPQSFPASGSFPISWLFTSGDLSIGASALVFPISGGSLVKTQLANVGDMDSIPKSGRSPGGGDDNPLQYACLENPMDRGAWRAAV